MKPGFSTTSIIREWDGIKIGLQTRYGTFGDLVSCSRCARLCYATSEFNLIAKTAARLTVFRIATGSPRSPLRHIGAPGKPCHGPNRLPCPRDLVTSNT